MLAGLIRLRVLRSILGSMPYIDLIARRMVIPVRSALSILVLFDSSEAPQEHLRFIRGAIQSWESAGHDVTIVDATSAHAHASRLRSIMARIHIFAVYAVMSDRRFDALIEIRGKIPFVLPALSVKPRYMIERVGKGFGIGGRIMDVLYRRVRRLHIDGDAVLLASTDGAGKARTLATGHLADAEKIVFDALGFNHHRAAFVRQGDTWLVTYHEPNSGILVRRRLALNASESHYR